MGEALRAAVKHIGSVGRYIELSDPRFSGVQLYTEDAGQFWFGDINLPEEQSKLDALASELGTTVYVIPDSTADDPRQFREQAIGQSS
jgi:hypothetical protein